MWWVVHLFRLRIGRTEGAKYIRFRIHRMNPEVAFLAKRPIYDEFCEVAKTILEQAIGRTSTKPMPVIEMAKQKNRESEHCASGCANVHRSIPNVSTI